MHPPFCSNFDRLFSFCMLNDVDDLLRFRGGACADAGQAGVKSPFSNLFFKTKKIIKLCTLSGFPAARANWHVA
jgi:hypothetical protein